MKIFFILLTLLVFSTAIAAQTSDTQFWNDLQLIIPLKTSKDSKNKKINDVVLNLDGILRLGRNVSYPVDSRFAATLDFRVNNFLKVSTGYVYQRLEQIPQRKIFQTRLSVAANLEKKYDLFSFRHRSQFEYRFLNSRPNTEVYRPRFQVAYSLKHNEKEIFAPFVSAEPFYDFKQHKWFRKEFYAGISKKLAPRVSLDVYYIRVNTKPVNVNALGTILKIKLR